jgi:hypothetical protein
MFQLSRWLLDKVAARLIVESLLKVSEGRSLNEAGESALTLFEHARKQSLTLFIVPQTAAVLSKSQGTPRYGLVIEYFRQYTTVVVPGRYFTRWTRRLKEHGFTPEDAAVLALATFGTDKARTVLGMNYVATYDRPMMNNWESQQAAILKRLKVMCRALPEPYHYATLPRLIQPQIQLDEP